MDVKKLFQGIVVIIDDEINKRESAIDKIKQNLIKINFPVVCYENIPDKEVVKSLTSASFIILDWNFTNGEFSSKISEAATELKREKEQEIIDFIEEIMSELFVPIFLFTGYGKEETEQKLKENLKNDKDLSRIFIRSKDDVMSEEDLLMNIEKWANENPSVYVLKNLEQHIQGTKNNMFLECYDYSPYWPTLIWKSIMNDTKRESDEDSVICQQEFGEFLMKTLMNRMNPYEFEDSYFIDDEKSEADDLKKLLEYERYIKYNDSTPDQAYTGDLFKNGEGKYLLNIRAQCDLSRKDDDVELYLLKGSALSPKEIVTEDLYISQEGELIFPNKKYTLQELNDFCDGTKEGNIEAKKNLEKVNSKLAKYKNLIFFGTDEIIEKKAEAIIPFIDNGQTIKFSMDLEIKTYKDTKAEYNRIGRILPPYITKIQQKFSQYIVREGVMSTPKELFKR